MITHDANLQARVTACVCTALVWEVTAAKPGNVYRDADFEDVTFGDFITAAGVVGAAIGEASLTQKVGQIALAGVTAMHAVVGTNTHLGAVLLLSPLTVAMVRGGQLADQVVAVVQQTTLGDAEAAYAAIRLAAPSGLGQVEQADVASTATLSLQEAMRLAADRDLIARQYTNGFDHVFATAEAIHQRAAAGASLHDAIVISQIELMSRQPDSLIARKCGDQVARESADRADAVLQAGTEASESFWQAAGDLDFWLRADGHRRNPGTTADLIAAALFVLLAEERLSWPVRFYSQNASND